MDVLGRAAELLANDNSLGPQYQDLFDFTLTFETSFFNVLPPALLIFACPLHIAYYTKQPVVATPNKVFWSKILLSIVLTIVEIVKSILWGLQPQLRTETSIAGTSLSCVAAFCVTLMIGLEHRHSPYSSTFLSVYLSIFSLLDVVEARSLLLRSTELRAVGAMTVVAAILKLVLVTLQEVPKTLRIDGEGEGDDEKQSQEASSGFWNRTLLLWINNKLTYGFRHELRMSDLGNLGPDFSSIQLSAKLEPHWQKANKNSQYALLKACLATFYWPFFSAAFPRLVIGALGYAMPYLIQRILLYVHEPDDNGYVQSGLIAATALIYVTIGIARASYALSVNRTATFVRGVLITQIFKKNLLLNHSIAKQSAALTLMSTDVEGVMDGTRDFHDVWISVFELVTGLCLLSTMIGKAVFLPIIPICASFAICWELGRRMSPAMVAWNASIEKRVSKMAVVLTQSKGIKMIGLEPVMVKFIQYLRELEIENAKKARHLRVAIIASLPIEYWFTPMVVLAGGLYWTGFTDGLDTVTIFVTLTFLSLISSPMIVLLNFWPNMTTMFACFSRIQAFLLLEERQDGREIRAAPIKSFEKDGKQREVSSGQSNNDKNDPNGCCISFLDASVAASSTGAAILQHIQLSIQISALVIVIGPVGSGKSFFLRSLLGETFILQGSIHISEGGIAFCDQKPWIPDATIQEVIIAENSFDQSWFDTVLAACALDYDISQLPNREKTLTGSNGVRLSGGQQQRVALARALYSRAPVLVLDDILSALDHRTAEHIFLKVFSPSGLLKSQGRTAILATHSIEYLPHCDQVLVVDKSGQITEDSEGITTPYSKEEESESQPDEIEANNVDEQNEVVTESIEQLKIAKTAPPNSQTDFSLYTFLFQSVSPWHMFIFLVNIAAVAILERMPVIYVRIWVGIDPMNKSYFFGFVGLGFLTMIINATAAWLYMIVMMPKVALNLHQIFLETVMRATLPFLTSTNNGSLLNRFSQDMTLLGQEIPMSLYRFLYMFFMVLADTVVIAAGAQYAGLMIPFLLVILYFLQAFYLRTSRQLRILDLEGKTPLYSFLSETTSGLEHIRSFGWEARTLETGLERIDHSQKSFYHMYCLQSWLLLVLDMTSAAIATILVAIAVTWTKTTNQPGLALALVSMISYSTTMRNLMRNWTSLETSLGAVARLRSFLKETPTEEDTLDAAIPPNWPERGVIKMTNVGARYTLTGASKMALEDITIEFPAGEKTTLVGRTGSGKSSLVATLLNFLDYTGCITIDGIDISRIPRTHLRQMITTIPQDAVDIPGTLRDNLLPLNIMKAPGQGVIHDEVIISILESVDLLQHVAKKVGDLDTPIEEMAFSHGQKQLLNLARAMLHKLETGSKIVIMDESTSSLDYMTEGRMQRVMNDAFGDCTRIVIAHRPFAFTGSSLIARLRDGRLGFDLDENSGSEEEDDDDAISVPEFELREG